MISTVTTMKRINIIFKRISRSPLFAADLAPQLPNVVIGGRADVTWRSGPIVAAAVRHDWTRVGGVGKRCSSELRH